MTRLNKNAELEEGNCPECGKPVKPDWMACPNCGERLSTACDGCGHSLEPPWKFCPSCGCGKAAFSSGSGKGKQFKPNAIFVSDEVVLHWLKRDDDGPSLEDDEAVLATAGKLASELTEEQFETLKEAFAWLKRDDDDGPSLEDDEAVLATAGKLASELTEEQFETLKEAFAYLNVNGAFCEVDELLEEAETIARELSKAQFEILKNKFDWASNDTDGPQMDSKSALQFAKKKARLTSL